MARSLNRSAKGIGALRAERGIATPQAPASAQSARAVPLDLIALVTPYKSKGKLTLRLERMPQLSRLSAGKNNGDNSWSLALDDLDGLTYFPPPGLTEEHALTVRIIAKNESEASTLALLEVPIAAEGATEPARAPTVLANFTNVTETKRSRAEDAKPLRVVETAPDAMGVEALVAREVAAARAIWKGEFERQLAEVAAKAAAELETARLTMQVERDSSLATKEKEFTDRLVKSLEDVRREAHDGVTESEKQWRRDEAARLTAVEAQWQADVRKAESAAESRIALLSQQNEIATAQLRDELARLQASFAERENSLGQAQLSAQQLDQNWQQKLHAALVEAEQVWKASEDARMAASEEKWQSVLQTVRAEAQNEQASLRQELATASATLADREAQLSHSHVSADLRDQHAQQSLVSALASAEQAWKEGENARIAESEARWQSDLQSARAEAQSQLGSLRQELASATAALADRDAQLSSQVSGDLRNENAQQSLVSALASAEQSWKAEEAARAAAAEIQWQARAQQIRDEAEARFEQLRSQSEAAATRLRNELSDTRLILAEKSASVDPKLVEAINTEWEQKLESALFSAGQSWKAAEAVRVQELETRLRERFEQEKASFAFANVNTPEGPDLRTLRDGVTALQGVLANRDAELTKLQAQVQQQQSEAEENLSKARAAWKSGDAERMNAAEAQWQEKSRQAQAELLARCEAAENALEAARSRPRDDDAYTKGLVRELKTLRASLVDREADLARAHGHIDEMRNRLQPDPLTHRPIRETLEEDDGKAPKRDTLVRDVALLAFVVVAVILFIPKSYLGYSDAPAAPAAGVTQKTLQKPALQMLPVLRSVNLRAEPSTSAAIITGLKKGDTVGVLEKQGSWTRVEFSNADAPLQGWVFGTYLGESITDVTPPAASPVPARSAPVETPSAAAVAPIESAPAVPEPQAADSASAPSAEAAPADAAAAPQSP